ncbi:MAG TPA: sigma-54 dependent transcriptional regulator [bacterium]|jgi:DNA-binding NtrC family response regulator|nr:sigma-54 dependent transcriptional regulator [bacterium]
MSTILLVDDKSSMRKVLRQTLEGEGNTILEAEDGEKALEMIKAKHVDLIISDIKMPKLDGMSLLKMIKELDNEIVVIIMTAYATIETAVEAMKLGAYDYITKPFSTEQVKITVDKAIERQKLVYENKYLREKLNDQYNYKRIIGNSAKMQPVYELIEKVSPTDTAVLIRGESGTGKELVAHAVHFNSRRKDKPFIKVNCAVLAEGVLESELFGHEKGSFTGAAGKRIGRFELANGGSIFLDEIGDINLSTQVKLLRVLQEKEFERVGGTEVIRADVRVIAATNKNLEEAIKKGQFREDLFFRLNVVPIIVPPLRDRREDVERLAFHFLTRYSAEANKKITKIDKKAVDLMAKYHWPGNVRELENAIQRAVVLADGDSIYPSNLPLDIQTFHKDDSVNYLKEDAGLTEKVENYEKELIVKAMEKANHVQTKAAKLLNVNRTALIYKLKKYGLLSETDADIPTEE